MVTLPDQLKHSLTWDQGKEMAEHVRFSIESGLSAHSQADLDAVARQLNGYPRQTLGWMNHAKSSPGPLRSPVETAGATPG